MSQSVIGDRLSVSVTCLALIRASVGPVSNQCIGSVGQLVRCALCQSEHQWALSVNASVEHGSVCLSVTGSLSQSPGRALLNANSTEDETKRLLDVPTSPVTYLCQRVKLDTKGFA